MDWCLQALGHHAAHFFWMPRDARWWIAWLCKRRRMSRPAHKGYHRMHVEQIDEMSLKFLALGLLDFFSSSISILKIPGSSNLSKTQIDKRIYWMIKTQIDKMIPGRAFHNFIQFKHFGLGSFSTSTSSSRLFHCNACVQDQQRADGFAQGQNTTFQLQH